MRRWLGLGGILTRSGSHNRIHINGFHEGTGRHAMARIVSATLPSGDASPETAVASKTRRLGDGHASLVAAEVNELLLATILNARGTDLGIGLEFRRCRLAAKRHALSHELIGAMLP